MMDDYFSGRVHSIVFENPAQGFFILRMVLDGDGKPNGGHSVVRGDVPGLVVREGTWFGFEGRWENHEQHGRQIVITRAPVVRSWTPDVAAAVLAANGVGEGVVARLREHL